MQARAACLTQTIRKGSGANWSIRKPRPTHFIAELDGLRFIAISLVFLHHLSWYLLEKTHQVAPGFKHHALAQYLLPHGHFGVQLFFTISGFVLALPFASHYLLQTPKPVLSSYFLRRVTRLEPPYLITLFLMYIGLAVFTSQTLLGLLPHLVASATYLHNLIFGEPSTINIVSWSLEIEVQFYLIAPVLTRFLYTGSRYME